MTFNIYKTTETDGQTEFHSNKRDAMRAAKAIAWAQNCPTTVEVLTHAGVRWDESAVVVRRETLTVKP